MAGYQYINPYAQQYQAQQYQSPYSMQPQQYRQVPIQVNGEAGANAYRMWPNDLAVLFDSNQDVFYLKQTDGAGFATMRAFDYKPREQAIPQQPEFITRDELISELSKLREDIKGMSRDAKQSISEQ